MLHILYIVYIHILHIHIYNIYIIYIPHTVTFVYKSVWLLLIFPLAWRHFQIFKEAKEGW